MLAKSENDEMPALLSLLCSFHRLGPQKSVHLTFRAVRNVLPLLLLTTHPPLPHVVTVR